MTTIINIKDIGPDEDIFGMRPHRQEWELGIDDDSTEAERLEAGFAMLDDNDQLVFAL